MENFRKVSLSRVLMRKGAAIVRGLRTLENDIRNKVVCFCEEITGKIPKIEKLFLVQDMVNMVYISRKLRTTSLPKLFLSAMRLREERSQPRKNFRSSIGEDGFGSSETNHGRKQCQNQRLIAGGGLQKQGHNPAKLLWVQILITTV
jgi:hypothetical protein